MNKDLKISILIIEDNAGDQILLQENLMRTRLLLGDIVIADTLTKGIGKINEQKFSLIFLDLFLSDSAGLDSFKELVKINSRIPVIIYSGLGDTQVALNAIAWGAQDFLIKGDYSISLLEKTVRYSIERKNSSDALVESNAKYTFLSKATHDMVWDWDLITDEVHRNTDGWNKIFKTNEGEEAGTRSDWPSRVHTDDRKRVQQLIDKAIKSTTQQLFEAEFRVFREDDTVGYIEDRGYIIRNEKGTAIRLIGASHDITERKNAEEKVLLSEQRFRSLVQNSSDLLAILNTQGNYTYVSPTSKKILGYDPEFFIGKNAFSFMHPDDAGKMNAFFTAMSSQKFVEAPLFRFKNSSGEWRWIESSITNLLDDRSVKGIVVNSRDVTERKIANDEIEKLSLVAKNTLSGVFILDTNRKIQWVNEAFTAITGFTQEDAIGKQPSELLYGNDPAASEFTELRDRTSKGLTYEGERINYTKSGKPIWVFLQLQPLYNDEGNVKQYFGVQTDITEKKNAEAELKKLSMVAKETINGVVISDSKQNVVWANDAFTKMSGYQLDEVIGKNPMQFLQGPETDIEVIGYVKNKIAAKEPFVFEILNYTKTKDKFLVRVQVQPIFDENGNVKQFFALQTDITKEKRLERKVELEKAIKQKQITEAVFAAQENERSEIGRELHDNVNQLLGATRLYIDMAKTNEETRESLLTSASTFTLDAIEEIRKLSKTLITPLINEIGLADLVKDIIGEVMLVHPVQILFTADNFIEEGLSDKFKLNIFRIIQEQINNTLKHARAKNININIEDNNGELIIAISDDGIGFDTSKRKTGVGITNIKSRTELYDGKLLLTSAEGSGTTLSITFNKEELLAGTGVLP